MSLPKDAGSPQFRSATVKRPFTRIEHPKDKWHVSYGTFFATGLLFWLAIFALPATVFWLLKQGYSTAAVFLLVLYAFWYLPRHERNPLHKKRWDRFLNGWMPRCLVNFCDMQLISTAELPADRRYLYCCHPHGIWPLQGIGLVSDQIGFSRLFPGVSFPRPTCASVLFRLPGLREVALWLGAITADRDTIRAALLKEQNVVIIVGGSAEILECFPGTDTLFLRERKGFIRLALETGTDLVPTYGFGVTSLYRQISWPWLKHIQRRVLKYTKMVLPIFYGSFSLIPFKSPIRLVVGEPIRVDRVVNPTPAQIDALHEEYTAALSRLFEQTKEQAGYPDAALRIV